MRSEAKTTSSHEVTYMMFLRNKRAMMATVSALFAMIFMLFFDGILTMHLITDLDVGDNKAGKIHIYSILFRLFLWINLCDLRYLVSIRWIFDGISS